MMKFVLLFLSLIPLTFEGNVPGCFTGVGMSVGCLRPCQKRGVKHHSCKKGFSKYTNTHYKHKGECLCNRAYTSQEKKFLQEGGKCEELLDNCNLCKKTETSCLEDYCKKAGEKCDKAVIDAQCGEAVEDQTLKDDPIIEAICSTYIKTGKHVSKPKNETKVEPQAESPSAIPAVPNPAPADAAASSYVPVPADVPVPALNATNYDYSSYYNYSAYPGAYPAANATT